MPKTVDNYSLTAQEVKTILAEILILQSRVKALEEQLEKMKGDGR